MYSHRRSTAPNHSPQCRTRQPVIVGRHCRLSVLMADIVGWQPASAKCMASCVVSAFLACGPTCRQTVWANNVGHVSSPAPHGLTLWADNVGRQNNVKMTTDIVGRQWWDSGAAPTDQKIICKQKHSPKFLDPVSLNGFRLHQFATT